MSTQTSLSASYDAKPQEPTGDVHGHAAAASSEDGNHDAVVESVTEDVTNALENKDPKAELACESKIAEPSVTAPSAPAETDEDDEDDWWTPKSPNNPPVATIKKPAPPPIIKKRQLELRRT